MPSRLQSGVCRAAFIVEAEGCQKIAGRVRGIACLKIEAALISLGCRLVRQVPVDKARRGGPGMRLCACRAEDVCDAEPVGLEIVGDQSAMTLLPALLRAHHCRPLPLRVANELRDGDGKRLSLHVVGVSAKSAVAPGGVV